MQTRPLGQNNEKWRINLVYVSRLRMTVITATCILKIILFELRVIDMFYLEGINCMGELSHFAMKMTAAYTVNVRLGSEETEVLCFWGRVTHQFGIKQS